MKKLCILLALVSTTAWASPSTNKKTVLAFYDMAFNQHKPAEAMQKYVGEKYTQHNPFVADGKQPFIEFFLKFQKDYPGARAEIKRSVAEGDLVVLHVLSKREDNDNTMF